jgi:hypothetical protein
VVYVDGKPEEVHGVSHPDLAPPLPAAAATLCSVIAAPLPEVTDDLPHSSLPLCTPDLAFSPLPPTKPASIGQRVPNRDARPPGEPCLLPH